MISGAKEGATRPTIEKAGSSVSLVRKKFERKVESKEVDTHPEKKPSRRMPRVKISQNLFLKGDTAAANAEKKCEIEVDMSPNNCHNSQSDQGQSWVQYLLLNQKGFGCYFKRRSELL